MRRTDQAPATCRRLDRVHAEDMAKPGRTIVKGDPRVYGYL